MLCIREANMITMATNPLLSTQDNTQGVAHTIPLEAIVTPSTVDFWPPAIGWWISLILIVTAVVFVLKAYRNYKSKWGYRKTALRLLDQSYHQWQSETINNETSCQHFFALLKRTAITAYSENKINHLFGDEWLETLRVQAPSLTIDDTVREAIVNGQYQKDIKIDAENSYLFCKQWILKHEQQWLGEDK